MLSIFLYVGICFLVGFLIVAFGRTMEKLQRWNGKNLTEYIATQTAGTHTLPYHTRKYLFSQAERSFLRVLENCIGPELKIYAKVRLADIFLVSKARGRSWRIDFSRIAQKHVDFLIVDEKGRQPIAGVELDDSSHQEEGRMARDQFVDQVFESAGLPIVHVPASYTYSNERISAMLLMKIPRLTQEA